MKTQKILFTITALGLASLPIVATSAIDGDAVTSVEETVIATVPDSCGLYDSHEVTEGSGETDADPAADYTFSKTMLNGELWNSDEDASFGHTYFVVCNDHGGWRVIANSTASMSGASGDIETGLATSGPTANWAFKIAQITGSKLSTDYSDYSLVPSGAGDVVVTASGATTSDSSFTTGYQIYIGTETPAGTYTGEITYTLARPAIVETPEQKKSPAPEEKGSEQSPVDEGAKKSQDDSGSSSEQPEKQEETPNSPAPSQEEFPAPQNAPQPALMSAPAPSFSQSSSAPSYASYASSPLVASNTPDDTLDDSAATEDDDDDSYESKADALGVEASSADVSQPTGEKSNLGLVIAASVVGVAAVAGGTAFYIRGNKENESQ